MICVHFFVAVNKSPNFVKHLENIDLSTMGFETKEGFLIWLDEFYKNTKALAESLDVPQSFAATETPPPEVMNVLRDSAALQFIHRVRKQISNSEHKLAVYTGLKLAEAIEESKEAFFGFDSQNIMIFFDKNKSPSSVEFQMLQEKCEKKAESK